MREELYDSRDNRRLLKRLAESSGGPAAVGRSILQDIREFSAGHAQADDITLICFGSVLGECWDELVAQTRGFRWNVGCTALPSINPPWDSNKTQRSARGSHVTEDRQRPPRARMSPRGPCPRNLPRGSAWTRTRSRAGGSCARASTLGGTTTSISSTRPRSSCPKARPVRRARPGAGRSSRSRPSGSTGPSRGRSRWSTGP